MGCAASRTLDRAERSLVGHDDALRMGKIRHALPEAAIATLLCRRRRVGRKGVIGQKVDKDSLIKACFDSLLRREARAAQPHLAEQRRLMRVRLGGRHDVFLAQKRRRLGDKAVIVRARHSQIDIIIPRDKAAVAQRPEHRSRIEEVRDAQLAAHAVDFL